MEKRCTEATEYSLTFRMARYPNWRQVAENGIPAGDYSHARICSGGASASAPSDLAGAQPVRSVTARLKSNDSVDDLRTPVVARPFCYPPRLSGSGISISFSAASIMNFRWPATLGFEKYASSGWLAPSYTTTSSKSKGLKPDRQATLTPY